MQLNRLILAIPLTTLWLPANDLSGGLRPTCDPTIQTCLATPETPRCDVTACFSTTEAQTQYEIEHNCVFPQKSSCSDTITEVYVDVLRQIFSFATEEKLEEIAAEFNANLKNSTNKTLIDTKIKLAHFLSQIRAETGRNMQLTEKMNYSTEALKMTFSYFKTHPDEAELYGRKENQPANQEAIGNRVYANRNGNGDITTGDGWRYRGRGVIQLTGKVNYQNFTIQHNAIWPDDNQNFVLTPDLIAKEKYAVRSGLVFWRTHNLHSIAEQGTSCSEADSITRIINRYTSSYHERCNHLKAIMKIPFFQECE